MTIAALRNNEGLFSGNSAQKDHREHCKTPQCWCWFDVAIAVAMAMKVQWS